MNSYYPYDDIDERLDIENAICNLSDRDLTVLTMKACGYKHKDIAKEVGLSTNYIGKLIKKLINKISTDIAVE